jgi:hypothetical protein
MLNRRSWYRWDTTAHQCTAGDGWHLNIYICGLMYSLAAADVLQPSLDVTNGIAPAMHGHLVTGRFWWNHPFRMVRTSYWLHAPVDLKLSCGCLAADAVLLALTFASCRA